MEKVNSSNKSILYMLFFLLVVSIATLKAVGIIKKNYKQTILLQINSMYSQNLLKTNEDYSDLKCFVTERGEIVTQECPSFYDEFMQDIPVKNYCKSKRSYSCIPNYRVSGKTPQNYEDIYEKLINKSNDSIILKKNKLMIIASDNKAKYPIFAIDINGTSPPNIIGEDLILVTLRKKENGETIIETNSAVCDEDAK